MNNKRSVLFSMMSLIIMIMLPVPLLAQTPPVVKQPSTSTKGAVIKGRAPVNKEILKVTLPKPYVTRLRNGLEVIIYENHKLPTFNMQMVILAGGQNDPESEIGTATSVADLLRGGTKTRSSKQIAEDIDKVGGSLFSSSGLTSITSTINVSGLKSSFDSVLDIFADVIINPTFPSEELEKLKTRDLNMLRMQRSQPSFLADESLMKALYGSHPASRTSAPEDNIKNATREMLEKFHSTYYKPNNAILAVVGDVNKDEVIKTLEQTFASWKSGEVNKSTIAAVSETGPSKIHLIDRPDSAQTTIVVGTLSITRTDPDYFPLQVMNKILGGGASARLFLNLREEKSYTYGAYSYVTTPKYRGIFSASTDVRQDVTKGAMDELMLEFKRIRDERVPDTELELAKRNIVGSWALQLEFPQSVIQNAITSRLHNLPSDYWDTYPQKISAITQDDVIRVAKKYIDLNKLQIVTVGEAAKIIDALKPFGKIEIYDTNGKSITPVSQ